MDLVLVSYCGQSKYESTQITRTAELGHLVKDGCDIPYEDIPHFVKSTAPGHKSRLLIGTLNDVCVVLMQGRFHVYEGYEIHQVSNTYII